LTTLRPTLRDLDEARDRLLPDVVGPDLRVLFCGINPGLWSAATGLHFARPGNRFWPALYDGGFTPRRLDPSEQDRLPALGLGLTNMAARSTARAEELDIEEIREGGRILVQKVERLRPAWVAVLGVTAYRQAYGQRHAQVGEQQERIGSAHVWVLPNPSGLNAHYSAEALATEFAALRSASLRPGP
jgi:TDG/mug DNA glycosylase family protein